MQPWMYHRAQGDQVGPPMIQPQRGARLHMPTKKATTVKAQDTPVVRCLACERVLLEASSTPSARRRPCPDCGSTDRLYELHLASTVTVRSKIGLKARSAGSRKPFLRQVSGDDLFRLTGQWNILKQIIDRRRNYYLKVVTDSKTGKVIRYCEEPLSRHQGRGSARKSSRRRQPRPPAR